MGVIAEDDSVRGPVGAVWPISVAVSDVDCVPSQVAPVITVTDPDGTPTTPDVTGSAGVYAASVTLDVAGRWVAHVDAPGYGAADLTAYAMDPVDAAGMPDRAAVIVYLGLNSWTDGQIDGALAAEEQAQRDVCTVPADYPKSLREALLRRVQRNLAMHKLPLAVLSGDADAGQSSFLPRFDPEVRRLEGPYRRRSFGAAPGRPVAWWRR